MANNKMVIIKYKMLEGYLVAAYQYKECGQEMRLLQDEVE